MPLINDATLEYFKKYTPRQSEKAKEPEEEKGVSLFDLEKEIQLNKNVVSFTASQSMLKNPDVILDVKENGADSDSDYHSVASKVSQRSENSNSLEQRQMDEYELMQLQQDKLFLKFTDESKKEQNINYKAIQRSWKATFTINAIQNLEKSYQYFFYVLDWSHTNKNLKIGGALSRKTIYTAGMQLQQGAYKYFSKPLNIWTNKKFKLPYSEIENYSFNIQIWSINEWTFNQFYADCNLSLKDVIEFTPDMSLIVQRSIQDRTYEAQRIKIFFQLQEIFEFDLIFESWSYVPSAALQHIEEPKYLEFKIPKGAKGGWQIVKTNFSTNGFWISPLVYTFQGTLQELVNSYFTVSVLAKNKKPSIFKKDYLIGRTIMSLQSVTAYPLFRGLVKQLTLDQQLFYQGEVFGNIRCYSRSLGVPFVEDPVLSKKLEQPVSSSTVVSQLDVSQQYLVVRVFKCENLPAASTDSGTSDPLIKVKWDNIVLCTDIRPQTLKPVFNQNIYFPIRLLDDIEMSAPIYRKVCLPIDLLSKGNIIFECWDQDETSSDFLGGIEVYFSDIINKGVKESRCLAEGLNMSDKAAGRLPDGRPAAFAVQDDQKVFEDTEKDSSVQPFETKYMTHVYRGHAVELVGSSIPINADAAPCIYFEIFCIPPLPDDLHFAPRQHQKETHDMFKQWDRRWHSSYKKWLKVYMEWFPDAISNRRFTCTAEHPQTRRLYPLPAFVTPIAIAEKLTSISELLHWIQNMTFIVSHQMRRTGQFQRWLTPNYMLTSRKGGINDHAVLLCNCLLGLNYDAYVCKGTIENGKMEHCWAMIRHSNGWVTFIETTTKMQFHLPSRWMYPLTQKLSNPDQNYQDYTYLLNKYNDVAEKFNEVDQRKVHLLHIFEENVVPDVTPELDEFKEKIEDAKNDENATARAAMLEWFDSNSEPLTIFPNKALLTPETLAYVPYSSIETVFNHQQLWGNLQNHHPATITYDFNDPALWKPFLTEPAKPIDSMVFVAPSTRDKLCEVLSSEIQADIGENIRIWRHRKGLDTFLDHSAEKTSRLEKYFDLLEYKLRLDVELDPGPPPDHQGWSAWNSSHNEWYENLQKPTVDTGEDKLTESFFQKDQQLDESLNNRAPVNQFVNIAKHTARVPSFGNSNTLNSKEKNNETYLKKKSTSNDFLIRNRKSSTTFKQELNQTSTIKPDSSELVDCSNTIYSDMSSTSDLEIICERNNIQLLTDDNSSHVFKTPKYKDNNKFDHLNTLEIPVNADQLWAEFEDQYSKANIAFELNCLHGSAIEDYADFESRVHAMHQPKFPSPVTAARKFTNVNAVAPETPYKTVVPETQRGVNVESLGFKVREHATNVISEEKISERSVKQTTQVPQETLPNSSYMYPTEQDTVIEPEHDPNIGEAEAYMNEFGAPQMQNPQGVEADTFPLRRHVLPVFDQNVYNEQINKWRHYYRLESLYYRWQRIKFPVKPCHAFCGFPLHLSTTDLTDIRTFLLSSKRFRKVLDLDVEGITYCVRCKTYPLMGGVISLWVFLGYEVMMNDSNQRFHLKKNLISLNV